MLQLFSQCAFYRPPAIRLHDKVYIPQDDHPDINFVGLLIGPRGNTLKALENEVCNAAPPSIRARSTVYLDTGKDHHTRQRLGQRGQARPP